MSPALALQAAIRARLVTSSDVLALVPADHIVGAVGKPTLFPCVMLGQDQEVDEAITLERRHVRVHATLHTWDRTGGLSHAKALAGAIRDRMRGFDPVLDGMRCVDIRFAGSRVMSDPDGSTTHGVVENEALVELPS